MRQRPDGQQAKQYGVTEQLKAENQIEWVRQMNACKAQAEEIVKAELIYDRARKSGQKTVRTLLIFHKSCGRIVHKFYGIIYTSKANGKSGVNLF